MPDAEAIVQLILDPNQQRIVDLSIWLYEMRCKRDLRRAHGPNVEIVDFSNPGQFGEIIFHGGGINTRGYRGQREIERLAKQSPSADRDDDTDQQTNKWIKPEPLREVNRDARSRDAERDRGVGRHVHEGALQIQVPFAARHKHQSGHAIDNDANRSDPDHGRSYDGLGMDEPPNRLPRKRPRNNQQDDRVGERSEN